MYAPRSRRASMARSARDMSCALIAVGAIAALALSGCGDDDDDTAADAAASTGSDSLAGTSWVLASYVVQSDDVAAVGVAALDFGGDGSTMNGSTGCNSFGGQYEQDGTDLVISLGPTTLVACADDVASEQEQAILELLP